MLPQGERPGQARESPRSSPGTRSRRFLLCGTLFYCGLVPRPLAAFGVAGSILQISGVSLRGILGYPPNTWMGVPLAPASCCLPDG